MEPEHFTVPPPATDHASLADAIPTGYRNMDLILGRLLRDYPDATLKLCTALSQQPWVETTKCTFRPRQLWWRADRHPRPQTFLPVRTIAAEDAWCEDAASRHYNQPIRLDRAQSGDRLRRDDHLYDFIVEIDHNRSPRIAGRGSAVFLHLARGNFGPTAGCVSMTKSAMLRILARLGPNTKIVIG